MELKIGDSAERRVDATRSRHEVCERGDAAWVGGASASRRIGKGGDAQPLLRMSCLMPKQSRGSWFS